MSRRPIHCVWAVALLLVLVGLAQGRQTASGMSSRPGGGVNHPLRHDLDLIENWARHTESRTYAGTYYAPRGGGVLVLGFTRAPHRNLRTVRAIEGILDPERLVLRNSVPRYSLRALRHTEGLVVRRVVRSPRHKGLVTGWYIDVRRNVLVVRSERTSAARMVLNHVLNASAPVLVRHGERAVGAGTTETAAVPCTTPAPIKRSA